MSTRFASSMNLLLVTMSLACARPSPPANAPSSAAAVAPSPVAPSPVAPSPAPTIEHSWNAKKGAVVLTVSDQPGPIVDTTAPPPPPGYPAPTNPYLSATCAGDALGCSEAGTLLRNARSAQEFVEVLRKGGFEVTSH